MYTNFNACSSLEIKFKCGKFFDLLHVLVLFWNLKCQLFVIELLNLKQIKFSILTKKIYQNFSLIATTRGFTKDNHSLN